MSSAVAKRAAKLEKAGDAHLKGLFVSVPGILRRGPRIHRREGATDFAVVSNR